MTENDQTQFEVPIPAAELVATPEGDQGPAAREAVVGTVLEIALAAAEAPADTPAEAPMDAEGDALLDRGLLLAELRDLLNRLPGELQGRAHALASRLF